MSARVVYFGLKKRTRKKRLTASSRHTPSPLRSTSSKKSSWLWRIPKNVSLLIPTTFYSYTQSSQERLLYLLFTMIEPIKRPKMAFTDKRTRRTDVKIWFKGGARTLMLTKCRGIRKFAGRFMGEWACDASFGRFLERFNRYAD